MKEIKFRAWHEGNKSFEYADIKKIWMNGVECVRCGGYSPKHTGLPMFEKEIFDGKFFPNANWEQYTGLKDKNGKEIYEGDKVHWEGHGRVFDYTVVFRSGSFMARVNEHHHLDLSILTAFTMHSSPCEIIGNIHE